MKKILLILITISFQVHSYAQKMYEVRLNPENINFNNKNFYIDSIVDARVNKANIGEVQKGIANRKVKADLQGGFIKGLTDLFKTSLSKKGPPSKRIILVITQFQIAERTFSMKERGYAETALTFCIADSGKLKKVFDYMVKTEGGGMDVTGGHEKRLEECLNKSLLAFSTSDWETKKPEDYNEMKEIEISKNDHILFTNKRVRGIYKNFNELISNSPSVKIPFRLINKNKFTFIEDVSTGKRIKDFYGFCDGNNLFINTLDYNPSDGKHFSKFVEEGRYCVFLDHYVGTGEQIAAGVALGAIGSALARSGWDAVALDMKNGEIIVMDEKGMKRILKEDLECYTEYFYLKEGKNDINVQLRLVKKFNERNKLFK